MHYICYCCEECNAHFAIQSLDDNGVEGCPVCNSEEIVDTGEVIVNPHILGKSVAKAKGYI